IGSLVGIGLFTLLSFLWAPSVVWGILVGVAFVVLVRGRARWLAIGAAGIVVVALLSETLTPGVSWSPYYKVTPRTVGAGDAARTYISVNGVPHQSMSPASWKLSRSSEIYAAPY